MTNDVNDSNVTKLESIKNNFNEAFENLSEESKNCVIQKPLKLAVENSEGILYQCSVNSEGVVYARKIEDDVIKIHYLKNRFVIKETISDLYLFAPKIAINNNLSAIALVESIEKTKESKSVYLCALSLEDIPHLYPATCDNIKNITKICEGIYIIQHNELLIAVTEGVKIGNIREESIFDCEKVEDDRSYV